MSNVITVTDRLVIVTCWCGINHAVPQDLHDYQKRCHDNGRKVPDIYCPLGHAYIPSGKGEAEREREMRERAEARLVSTRDQLDAEKKAHTATKGQLTKVRNRAARGICPCCKRSFVDVARHVATKHPDLLEHGERALP